MSWGSGKRKGVTEDCRWEKDSSTWWIKLSTLASPVYLVMPINSLKLKLHWELRVRVLMEGRNNSPFKDSEQFISYLRREAVTPGKERCSSLMLGRKTCFGFETPTQLHCRLQGDRQRPGSRRRNAGKRLADVQGEQCRCASLCLKPSLDTWKEDADNKQGNVRGVRGGKRCWTWSALQCWGNMDSGDGNHSSGTEGCCDRKLRER